MQERYERLPAGTYHQDERGRRDQHDWSARGTLRALRVTSDRPFEQVWAEHEVRDVLLQDEGAVGKLAEVGRVVKLCVRVGRDALGVELCVDGVSSDLVGMKLAPDRREAVVVLAAAERARAMSRRERRRLVEEEELGKTARLKQRVPVPASKLEPTSDPAPARVAPANASAPVVQATPVSVYEAAGGIRDKVAERRDPVLQRHLGVNVSTLRNVRSVPPREAGRVWLLS